MRRSILMTISRAQMLILFNAKERTVGDFVKLLAGAGWKLERVYPTYPNGYFKLVSSPI